MSIGVPKPIPGQHVHHYHASAYVLSGSIKQPVSEEIKPKAQVELRPDGGFQFEDAEPFRLFGVLAYTFGYSQVAGHMSTNGRGFTTISTSVVENLNIMDVITVDRIVAQISTEQLIDDLVPSVTFLGTRFENLRIGGNKVDVEQDLDLLGPRPKNDRSYLEVPEVLHRISRQRSKIHNAKNLPEWANKRFPATEESLQNGRLVCSLVTDIAGAPGVSFGHIVDVPHFGKIFLGELTISGDDRNNHLFELTMMRLEMGSIASGTAAVANVGIGSRSRGAGNGGGPGTHGPGTGPPS